MTARTPITITITVQCHGDSYDGHIAGWGVQEGGPYGSLWCRDVRGVAARNSPPSEVLRGLCDALLSAVSTPPQSP